jgi:PTH1 family peptidyl-tRNA hydrolase
VDIQLVGRRRDFVRFDRKCSMFFNRVPHVFVSSRHNSLLGTTKWKHIFSNFVTHTNGCRKTRLIVGLGNPGLEYEQTRHNVGFLAVNKICQHYHLDWSTKTKFDGFFSEGKIHGYDVVFVKPTTFMNESGRAVKQWLNFLQLKDLQNLLVIFDTVYVPLGEMRFKREGGHGGQKGMENIINVLHMKNFPRLAIGIGPKPNGIDLRSFVLSNWNVSEIRLLNETLDNVQKCVDTWLLYGETKAMNDFNKPYYVFVKDKEINEQKKRAQKLSQSASQSLPHNVQNNINTNINTNTNTNANVNNIHSN